MMQRRLDRIFDERAGLQLLKPGDRREVELLRLRPRGPSSARRPSRSGRPPAPARAPARQRTNGSSCVAGRRESRTPAREGCRRQEPRSLRRTPCARSACRAEGRHRPCTEDRRGSANRRGSPRSRSRRAARVPVDREQPRGGDRQQRPKPLAAADRGMAHRFVRAVAAVARSAPAVWRRTRRLRRGPAPLRPSALRQPVDRLNRHRTA